MIDLQSLMAALPELALALFGFLMLIASAFFGPRGTKMLGLAAVVAFVEVGICLFAPYRLEALGGGAIPVFGFGSYFVDDSFARFAKAIVLAASSLSVLLSWSYFQKESEVRSEYPVLIVFATLGMMLMISASNLLALYVGLELQSLSLYVLAAIKRDDARSSEAGLKYFVLGAFSSGILLYGVSLIYGFAGTTDFVALAMAVRDNASVGVLAGMVFVSAGLAFKVSGVPFHMWAPDVYEGAPTPVTAFFASAPKLAALALFTRFLLQPMAGLSAHWHQVIVFIAVASMLWGAFAGLAQTNLKRLLAYSSIANVGALLVGFVVGGDAGVQATLVYFAIYALNTLGAFAVLLCMRRDGRAVEGIGDLSGLSKTNPIIALAMAVLMFSLAGIPPLAGFFGKYFVFLAAVQAHLVPLALIGVVSSVVTATYYLRIIKIMYFDDPVRALDPLPDWGVRTVLALSALAMIVFTIVPSPLIEQAHQAAKSFAG